MKLNSTAQLLDEKGKIDEADQIMFADSTGIQIDNSRLVDTRDGLLVKDAIICRAMVLDYNEKKILKSPEALADEIREGKRDLSPGYYADIIEEPETFNDEPYEAVQKKVLYDHLAVVKVGRCSRPKYGILDSMQRN